MSDSLLGNPKVTLGFAGVVVAIALVASVALEEYSSADEAAQGAAASQAAQAPGQPQPAASNVAQSAATGWGDDGGVADDWGAPSAAAQNGGFAGPTEMTNDAPVFTDHVSKSVSGNKIDGSRGPTVTSSAAPGAPEVVPPRRGATPQIEVAGN